MEANELRIGNNVDKGIIHWIGYDNGILACGILENEYSSFAKTIKLESIKPIPLTEEWLLKFGFEKLNRDIPGYEKDNLIVEWLFERWTGRLYYDCDTLVQIIQLNSIHQLQNLSFALTQTELTIKL